MGKNNRQIEKLKFIRREELGSHTNSVCLLILTYLSSERETREWCVIRVTDRPSDQSTTTCQGQVSIEPADATIDQCMQLYDRLLNAMWSNVMILSPIDYANLPRVSRTLPFDYSAAGAHVADTRLGSRGGPASPMCEWFNSVCVGFYSVKLTQILSAVVCYYYYGHNYCYMYCFWRFLPLLVKDSDLY